MALKPLREEIDNVAIYNFGAAAEKGGFASNPSSAGVVEYATDPSGAKVIGVLMMDVIAETAGPVTGTVDRPEVRENSETPVGDPVNLVTIGKVSTNLLTGATPAAGDPAYLAASGYVSKTQATGAPQVGKFLEAPDSDGYVLLKVEL